MDDCSGSGTSNWVGSSFSTVPANDLCADAEVITCAAGTVFGTTVAATVDAPGICITSVTAPGVWYMLSSTGYDLVDLTLCNTLPAWDSKLSVYSGDCTTPICVTGNDDFCGALSAVSFISEPGVDYYILVHGFGASTGAFQLDITCTTTYLISGNLTYGDVAMTPIDNSEVDLYDNTPTFLGTLMTDPLGYFETRVLAGDYSLEPSTTKPRGGTEVGDINLVINHILGTPLTGLQFTVSDLDVSTLVDVGDLNLMINDILGSPGWAAPDWIFENPAFTVAADIVVDIQGLCSGDPNASYVVLYSCDDPTGLVAINIAGFSADLTLDK